jgi:Flp pilus assembly protein TadD
MTWRLIIGLFLLIAFSIAGAQSSQSPDDQPHIQPRNAPKEEPPPPKLQPKQDQQQDQQQKESSSRDSQINLEGPSKSSGSGSSGIHELYPYDPHKAAKDIEVGEFYLKRKNYRAALDRFNEALLYKPNDAEATFRLAQTQEKLGLFTEASQNYSTYLKTFPEGPFVKDANEGLKRVGASAQASQTGGQPSADLAQLMQEGEADLARNDFDDAHEVFVKALQISPEDPVANFRLGQSLQGLQRLDEARIFYRKYLTLQPNGKLAPEAKREISKIEMVLGK